MTALDDAVNGARLYLQACENVLAAARALSPEHRLQLAKDYPTLTAALGVMNSTHSPLDAPPK